jgi:spore coat polysaccharide biosynthesis protein SpsF
MTVGCIIQARMGSTRLPGKVMMTVDKKNPVLYYVISQLQHSKFLNKIVIATTDLKEDDKIVEFAQNLGIDYFRGSSSDVLDRYYQCAKKFSFSTIVRITSDDPLIDPEIVDQVIKKFYSGSYDYVTNTLPRTFPYGTETEVLTFEALHIAWIEAKQSYEREHVTPYLYNNPDKFKIGSLIHSKNISFLRWTVDKQTDLELVRIIVSKIKKTPILMDDIINLLTKEPQLIDINKDQISDNFHPTPLKTDE